MSAMIRVMASFVIGTVAVAATARTEDKPRRLAEGDRLPPLRGEFLTGRDAELPTVAKGKVAFAALGFTYDSRFAVEAWSKRFKQEYGGRADVTFFEVPMIGGMGRLGKFFIDRGMRKGTPPELHENVITVYGGTGDWKARVGYRDRDAAYLLLLDRDGTIRWMHAGPFDEQAFTRLQDVIRPLLSSSASSAPAD